MAEELVSGAVTAQFTYGLMRIDQRRTATSFYGYDAGGSVRQLTDNTGSATDTYTYDAFGNTVAQTGSTVNEFQYRGEQHDSSLQMYYLRARYYRPVIGRLLTADAYEGGKSEPSSHHQYAYTSADPVNGIDPSGRANLITWAARVGVISELAVGVKQAGIAATGLVSLGEFSVPQAEVLAEEAIEYLGERVDILEEGVEWFESQPGHVTVAVAQLENAETGEVIQVVAPNARHLTGRIIDAIIAPFEVPVTGFTGHAEEQIIKFAGKARNVISIAANRPICQDFCQPAILAKEIQQGFKIFTSALEK